MSMLEWIGDCDIRDWLGVRQSWDDFPHEDTNLVVHFVSRTLRTTAPAGVMFTTPCDELAQDTLRLE